MNMITSTKTPYLHPAVHHIYDETTGKRETIDTLLGSKNEDKWRKALSMELGRLAQGNCYGVEATECIEFIPKTDVPLGSKITYANMICEGRATQS